MKKIYTISVGLLFVAGIAAARLIEYAPSIQSLESMGLHGKITSFKESHFRVKYNENTASPYSRALDSASSINYYYELIGANTYQFNKDGLLTEKVLFDTNGKEPLKTSYSYDNGAMTGIANYRGGWLMDSLAFKNRNTRLRHREMDVRYSMAFDHKGRYVGRVMYTYNNGNLITIRRKDKDNVIIEMIKYDFHNGRLTEISVHDKQLKLVKRSDINIEDRGEGRIYTSELKYDNNNRFLGMESFLQDTAGNHIEETVADSNRRVVSFTTNKYSKKNELLESTVFSDRQYVYKFKYDYDNKENLIKKQVYRNDTLIKVVEWAYEYYAD